MAQAKTPRKSTKAFGGYQISFAGRTDTVTDVFGDKPLAPSEMTKRLWSYVKKHQLANTR